MPHDEYVDQAHALLRSFVQAVLARLAQDWTNQGLSLPQLRLLVVLFHIGPATIGQIAEKMHIGQSAASLLVDRLVQAHLAERAEDPADRRRAIVRLNEAGEALLGRQRAGQQRMHDILNRMDDTHLAMFIETFSAILALAEEEGVLEEGLHA
jgi:MarR family transcriptional regulator, organic hydroperoxide resistance regulator